MNDEVRHSTDANRMYRVGTIRMRMAPADAKESCVCVYFNCQYIYIYVK